MTQGPGLGDAPVHDWAMRCAEASLANMLENWIPNREDDTPLYHAIWMERMDGEVPCTAWHIPGSVTPIEVNDLIGEQFRRRMTKPEPAPPNRRSAATYLSTTCNVRARQHKTTANDQRSKSCTCFRQRGAILVWTLRPPKGIV